MPNYYGRFSLIKDTLNYLQTYFSGRYKLETPLDPTNAVPVQLPAFEASSQRVDNYYTGEISCKTHAYNSNHKVQ